MVTISGRFGVALLGVVLSLVILFGFGVWIIYSENSRLNFSARALATSFDLHEVEYTNISESLLSYYSEIFQSRDVDIEHENFTIVMLTYKREITLPRVLLHYCKTSRVQKIVVIWNDVDKDIPKHILELSGFCDVPLVIIKETENKITNRFKPRKEILTDCVFILDDDRWIEDLTDVDFAFSVWQENRHRIVGFEKCQRTHSRGPDGSYSYDQPSPGRGVSIMMTATGFLHRAYLEMYFDPKVVPAGMLDDEDWTMYCDDILMNCVVAKFLEDVSWPQPSLVSIKPKGAVRNLEREAAADGGHPGLHLMRKDHFKRRSACLNKLSVIFGHLPLHQTKARVHESVA